MLVEDMYWLVPLLSQDALRSIAFEVILRANMWLVWPYLWSWTLIKNVALYPHKGSGCKFIYRPSIKFLLQFLGWKPERLPPIRLWILFGILGCIRSRVWNNDVAGLLGWIKIEIGVWVDQGGQGFYQHADVSINKLFVLFPLHSQ